MNPFIGAIMMVSVFTVYLIAMILIIAKKRKTSYAVIAIGLLLAAFMLWYHSTNNLGINL
jgi:glycerol uptake facilitator-like aquaporin